ncbi:hypothetical protein [Dictyobacter aurantiacus]|uniref:hypothetical protein n=1 Tax=Dictyobacter aurantiacus TaxID=1936993 RepID=UPI000F83FA28|nr:hypothetical protein [Dictyobacter aurantiacus]
MAEHLSKKSILLPLLLLLLLSGCDQSSSLQQTQKTPPSAPCGKPALASAVKSSSLGAKVAFDLGGCIHVQSSSGFTCSFSNLDPLTPGTLVLPKIRSTYDQGTLQSLENYLTAISKTGNGIDRVQNLQGTVPYPAFSANPDAFQLVPVSGILRFKGEPTGVGGQGDFCDEILYISNIGKLPIQISQISVRYTADTQPNNGHYNLIDACSMPSISVQAQVCLPYGSGGGFSATSVFALHPGRAGTVISNDFNEFIQPGDVIKVIISYTSLKSLSFSLVPSFTLSWPASASEFTPTPGSITGNGVTYVAPQLQETFTSASLSQFSCYALQGQQFIEVPVNDLLGKKNHWCM